MEPLKIDFTSLNATRLVDAVIVPWVDPDHNISRM